MAVNVSGGALEFDATINMTDFERNIVRMQAGINSLNENQKKTASEMEGWAGRASAAAAGFFSLQAASGFLTKMVAVRGEFQQVTMAFTTMLKSKDAADRLMAESVKLAATTPFNLGDVASGAKQLLAYGFNARDVTKELTKLGNIAAGVGSQLNDVVYLYGTLKASGRVTQMDINQFAGRGIPIYEELAKAMGKPVSAIRDLVSTGKVGFKDIEKAFAAMTSPAGKFFNLMEEQSKSLTGQLANLEDAFDQMLNKLGEASEDTVGGLISGLADIVENYERVLEILELLVGVYGAYRAALIINNVLITYNAVVVNAAGVATKAWTAAEVLQLTVWKLKEGALIRLNALVKSGALQIALYTAAIAAVGAIVYSFAQAQSGAEIAQEALNKSQAVGIRQQEKETEKLAQLVKVIRDANSSKHEAKEAYESLLLNTGKVLEKYTQEEVAAGKADKAMSQYTLSMRRAAEASANFQAFKQISAQLDELSEKGIKAVSMWDEIAKGVKNFGNVIGDLVTGKGIEFDNKKRNQTIVDSVTGDLKDAQAALLKSDPAIQRKLDQERKERDAEIKKEKEAANQADLDAAKKAAEKYAAIIERRNELERNLAENLKLAKSKSMSDEDQEIAAINKKYADQEAAIKKLNKSLLEKDRISLKSNDSAKMLELGVAGVQSSIYGKNGYQDELEKKRELYESYEQSKATFGLELAKKMYKDQIGEYESYTDFLKADIASRKNEDPSFANRLKGEVVTPLLIDSGKQDNERQKARLAEALAGSQTYEAEKAMLTKRYALIRNEIAANELITDKEARLKALNEYEALDNDQLKTDYNSRMGWAKRLNEELLVLTRTQVREQIKALENQFNDGSAMPQGVQDYLKKLKDAFNIGVDQTNLNAVNARITDTLTEIAAESDKSTPKVAEMNKKLTELLKLKKELDGNNDGKADKGIGKFLSDLGDGNKLLGGIKSFKLMADSAMQLSAALGGVDTAVGYTLDTIGQLTGAAASLAEGIVSKDPVAIVGGAVKLLTTVIGIGSRVKKMNQDARDAIEAWYKKAITGEQEYQNILKQRAVDRAKDGKNAIQGIVAETKARQDQLQGWADEEARIMAALQGLEYVADKTTRHGTWLRKEKTTKQMASLAGKSFEDLQLLLKQDKLEGDAKTMVERLIEMEKAGYDSKKALEELAKQYDELMTGTSQQGLSDAFFDFIKSGKTATEDVAEFFEKTMLASADSIFKNNILSDMVNTYYKSFAEAAKKEGGITDADRENLKKEFAQLGDNAKKAYEDFLSTVGIDPFAAKKEEGAKGALKRELTETTASEFLGITRASYDLNVQTLNSTQIIQLNIVEQTALSNQKLNVLLDIAVSTGETAANTKHLEEMKNTLNRIAGGASVDPVEGRDLGV